MNTNDQMTSKASMPQGFEAFGRTRGEADKVPLGSWVGFSGPATEVMINASFDVDKQFGMFVME